MALKRPSRATLAWVGVAFAAILALNVNYLTRLAFPSARVDLTEDRLYTISEGTRESLAAIDEPIRIRVYFTKLLGDRYPLYAQHFDRVRTLLDRYRQLAGGKLEVEYLDPEPFSQAEERAVADGLRGVPITDQGELGYFGIAAYNSIDERQVIAFMDLDREEFLEYDLTAKIHSLANPQKTVVGLITGIGIDGSVDQVHGVTQPWRIMDQIREFFAVETLADINEIPTKIDRIPGGVEIVLVVQPLGLSEKTLYAIDQFALGGGKVLVFADPSVALAAGIGFDEKLARLLKAWGIEIKQGRIAADRTYARPTQLRKAGQSVFTNYVAWLALGAGSINEEDAVSAGIEKLNVATAGVIVPVEGATTTVTTLLKTSEQSMEITPEDVKEPVDPVALLRNFKPSGAPMTIAVRVEGTAKSAFPDGPPGDKPTAVASLGEPPADTAEPAAGEPLPSHIGEGPVNAIVVADVDMLHDQFWVSTRDFFGQELVVPTANNAAFVVNALENLSGEPALIALRGRGIVDRPFELVRQIQVDAERRYRAKEKSLVDDLTAIEKRLDELQAAGAGNAVLGEEDRQMVQDFQRRTIELRRELRDVKLALRRDIDNLDTWLRVVNIAGVPAAFMIVGLGVAGVRRGRRARR